MRKKFCTHFAFWACWYLLNSLPLFGMKLTASQWFQLAYNYSSLVIVFYAVSALSRSYFNNISFLKVESLSVMDSASYLFFRWEVFGLCFIITGYVTCSVWLDNRYFGYQYESLQAHIDQRFIRQIAYVFAGSALGYYRSVQRRNRIRIESLKARVINLQDHAKKQNELQRASEEIEKKISGLNF